MFAGLSMLGVSALNSEITEINCLPASAPIRHPYRRERGAHDRLDAVHGHPTFSCILEAVLICSWCVLRIRLAAGRRPGEGVNARGSKCRRRRSCRLRGGERGQLRSRREAERQERRAADVLFGCHISVRNFILGGFRGKSLGKDMLARKKPPSYSVS